MKSLFEQLGGTYTRQGDCCLPDVRLPPEEERPIDIYGQRQRAYRKEHHRVLYYNLLTPADRWDAGRPLCRHRGADAETLSSAGRTIRRHRGRDAGNCIRVTNKRGAYGLRLFYMQKKNNAVLKRHCSKLR